MPAGHARFDELRREKEEERAEARRLAGLRADLGMPSDKLPSSLVVSGTAFGPEWVDYRVEMMGVRAGCESWPPPWPFYRMGPILTQVWRRCVVLDQCPAYVEARWHPERGETIRLCGLEHVARQGDAARALRGIRLLRVIDKRGRKPGSRNWTEDEFVAGLIPAYRACADANAYEHGDFTATEHAVSERMGIPYRSFGRYLEAYKISWPPV